MAAFNSVAELKPFKFMWKIQVKIIRLWKQYSAGGGLTIEMVLVDMSVSFSVAHVWNFLDHENDIFLWIIVLFTGGQDSCYC